MEPASSLSSETVNRCHLSRTENETAEDETAVLCCQVSARFALTAGENIGAGDPSEFENRQLWARAAGLSGASAALEALPLGYDTLLEDNGGFMKASAGGRGEEGYVGR